MLHQKILEGEKPGLQAARKPAAVGEQPARTSGPAIRSDGGRRRAMKDFEAAIGARYVSDDPTILRSYAWNSGHAGSQPSERLAPVKPFAVLLPDTTEEVQSIVKICLRHGLSFKAQSTGFLHFSLVSHDLTVALDLRRMNRLVELDADNQMAVIEPYVTVGDLMHASMKKGLMPHSVSAGWTHSPLASATSLFGIGVTGQHTSHNLRNLLSYEWVTPQGEIVRGGSAGNDSGWFAGEGPGPGFRGIIRGNVGAMGGLGVFTKIGFKLHPWDGKPEMEHVGHHPNYGIKLDDTERVYQCVWDDWDHSVNAAYELMSSKVANFVVRVPANQHGYMLAKCNREYWDQRRTGTLPEIAREENCHSWTLMAISASSAEAAWRDSVIRDIVARTGGRILQLASDHEAFIGRNLITSAYVSRAQRGGVAGVCTSFGVSDSMGLMPEVAERGIKLLAPYNKPGGRFTEGDRDQFWVWPNEGRHVWAENIVSVDSADDKAMSNAIAYLIESVDVNDRKPLGGTLLTVGADLSEIFGPNQGHFNRWMRKIKVMLDPAWTSDGDYIRSKPDPAAAVYPFARHFLFRSRWLLSKLMLGQFSKGKKPML